MKKFKRAGIILLVIALISFCGMIGISVYLVSTGQATRYITSVEDFFYEYYDGEQDGSPYDDGTGRQTDSAIEQAYDVPSSGKLELDVPFGKAVVTTHDSANIRVTLLDNYDELYIEKETSSNGALVIRLRTSKVSNRSNPTLTVYLPKSGVNNLDVSMSAGYFSMENVSLHTLDLDLDAGKADVFNNTVNDMNVDVSAGTAVIKHNTIKGVANIDISAGTIKFIVPKDQGFHFISETDLVGPTINLPESDVVWASGTRQRNNFKLGGKIDLLYKGGGYQINLSMDAGTVVLATEDY